MRRARCGRARRHRALAPPRLRRDLRRADAHAPVGAPREPGVANELALVEDFPEDRQLALQATFYEQYKYCQQDSRNLPSNDAFFTAVRQCGGRASLIGSLFYEETNCCGYDPQRRAFTCPVKTKQGFGNAPNPGSRLHAMHCVADANGALVPVGHDSVHLASVLDSAVPPWQFGVVAHAVDKPRTVQPMNGQTRRARSILSCNLEPTGCDDQPIWGNAIDYRIRLDQ